MTVPPTDMFSEDAKSTDLDPSNRFQVDLDGYEGPLDLLLGMARTQKVDLTKISILELARQYLGFIDDARRLRIELAADYLVMAAWLAFLKSRLLLPKEDEDADEPTGEELAAALAFRLQRLGAMRDAAAKLMNRNRLGRDIFARGMPEPVKITRQVTYTATMYDLLSAYSRERQRTAITHHTVKARPVWSIKQARDRLEQLVGLQLTWAPLFDLFQTYLHEGPAKPTVIASSFSATLEMARDGVVELRQAEAFAPLYVKSTGGDRPQEADNDNPGREEEP